MRKKTDEAAGWVLRRPRRGGGVKELGAIGKDQLGLAVEASPGRLIRNTRYGDFRHLA